MARTTAGNKKKRASSSARAGGRRVSASHRISIGRLIGYAALVLLLLGSLCVAGYVIFFRVAIASAAPVVFEEPHLPPAVVPMGERPVGELTPRVAIIIDDMGYQQHLDEQFLHLDLNLSFSFLPSAPYTELLERTAYQLGRTVLLHLPMEPRGIQYDPGPGALYLAQPPVERELILDTNLTQVPHAVGVNNHMGSRYSENEEAMVELVDMLASRQLFFVDSMTTSVSKGYEVARQRGLPAARRDVFLDNEQEPAAICKQLAALIAISRWRGTAVGIAHPYPETLTALTTCGRVELDRVQLVGIEQLVSGP